MWVCVGLVFGGLLLVITPPFQVPDEEAHFYRAFQVSDAGFIAEKRDARSGGFIPESLVVVTGRFMDLAHSQKQTTVEAILDAFSVPLDPSLRQFVGFENTSPQTPVAYLPQSLGMQLGKALGLGPLALLYLGRAANWIAALCVTLLAIRSAPVFKWVFVLLASMPMAVFEMASLSADAPSNAFALLWTALILRLALTEARVDARALVALCVTSLLLSLSKLAYAPLILLFVAIPARRLGGTKRFLAVFGGLATLNAAALGIWVFLMQDVFAPITWRGWVDPAAQLHFIATHPLQFADMLVYRFSGPRLAALLDLMVGRVLGWLDTPLPYALIVAYQLMLIGAALFDSRADIRVGARLKLLALALLIANSALVVTMVYLQAAVVGASVIADIQGRYFIPLSPLLLLLLYNRTLRTRVLAWVPSGERIARACRAGLVGFLVISSALTCFFVAHRYY